MKKITVLILSVVLLPACLKAQQRIVNESLVEVSGVVMTSDSMRHIPGVSVQIKGMPRGTVANDEGVFSLVAEKGDTLVFSVIGFKKKNAVVPRDFSGHFMSIAMPLSQDTTYLPPMVVHSYPSREEFANAFLNWKLPDDEYQLAKINTEAAKLQSAMYYTPVDGGEGVDRSFRKREEYMRSKGQMPSMNIFNPLAWAEFIKAIKDGDFKRKD